jgi:hypothetical protein
MRAMYRRASVYFCVSSVFSNAIPIEMPYPGKWQAA